MRVSRAILLPAVPGLMCAIGVHPDVRFGWQLVAIWLGAAAFCGWLRSWWWRAFWVLAVAQTALREPMLNSYMMLVMIGLGLAAAQAFSEMDPGAVMPWICAAGILLAGWVLGQQLLGWSTFGMSSAGGPLNSNAAGALLAMSLPAFFGSARRRILVPVVVAGLFCCRSTTGMLAALTGCGACALLFVFTWRRLVAGIVVAAVLTGIFFWKADSISDLQNNPRWAAWRHTVLSYRSAPLGRGLGSFEQLFPMMTASDKTLAQGRRGRDLAGGRHEIVVGHRWVHAHNEYLEAGFELGLPAPGLLIAFLGAMVAWAWRGRQVMAQEEKLALAGVAASAVAAAGFYTIHIAPVALVGCAWLGMATRAIEEKA